LRSQKKETLFTDAQRIMAQAGCILGKGPKMEAILEKQRSQDGWPQEKGRSQNWKQF
jgi:hypothetical protein